METGKKSNNSNHYKIDRRTREDSSVNSDDD